MATEPEQSILDLTARTETADSDLLHINSEGTDYKETKIDFLQGGLAVDWATDSLLTSQVNALPKGSYFGVILSNNHQTETGVPQNASYYVHAFNYSNASGIIYLTQMNNGDNYYIRKYQSTWESSWTKEPTREEMNRIYSDLASITAGSSVTLTVASNSRIILFATGGADSRCGAWHIFVASTGGVVVSPIGTVGSNVSVSSSGANKIVISNTTSGSGSAYINAIVFAGSIS